MFTTRTEHERPEHERPEHLDMVEMNIHVSYHVNPDSYTHLTLPTNREV